jgi:hypothetical protein
VLFASRLTPLAFALTLTGCREAVIRLSGPGNRLTNAEEMFGTLAARVTQPVRDARYDSARVRLVKGALLPSRVWNDTSVWTSATSSRRTLVVRGAFDNGRYRFVAADSAPYPSRPAEARHLIHLSRLSDDEYAWDTDVPFAIGSTSAAQVGAFVGALFASAEGRTNEAVRADFHALIPRTTSVLTQLFELQRIQSDRLPDGSTHATFDVLVNPAGVQGRYPNFAQYVRRYVMTGRTRWSLADGDGRSYLELSAINGRLGMRVRTKEGGIVALNGPLHPMPDTLTLQGEVAMKVRRFTVGFHSYRAQFVIGRTDHERYWSVVSRVEPQWTLPLITEHLIRTPLRRPFKGGGAQFRIGVRDSAGAQSILARRVHLEVQESLILRFLGRLGAIAAGDYHGKTEREQMAWLHEVFSALVADTRAFGSRHSAVGDPLSREPRTDNREP